MALILFRVRRRKQAQSLSSAPAQRSKSNARNFFAHFLPQPHYIPAASHAHTRISSETNQPLQDGAGSAEHGSNSQDNRQSHRLSVRSIVTLPPYHVAPLPSERLIAREGERAGVDTVIEYPESEDEIEQQREQEMATLYDIRQARRREQSERAARRAGHRGTEARDDQHRLSEPRAERSSRSRARNASNASAISDDIQPNNSSSTLHPTQSRSQQDSDILIAELRSLREHNSRNQRAGSVSYADLGVARHDGSRVRGSFDSDQRPLLGSGTSINGGYSHSRGSSIASDREPSRSRATLQTGRDRRPSTAGSHLGQDDNGFLTPTIMAGDIPPEPPSYEDDINVHGGEAPPYQSPVETQRFQFPVPAYDAPAESTAFPAIEISRVEPTTNEAADAVQELPQLQLNTTSSSIPPAIEVVAPTPGTAFPPTPSSPTNFRPL